MPTRRVDEAFNQPASPSMLCADLADELHAVFGKTREAADLLKSELSEGKYNIAAELLVAPEDKISGMIHRSGMGDGGVGALAVLLGSLASPHTWYRSPANAAPDAGAGPNRNKKGGVLPPREGAERSKRRENLTVYDLPKEFDQITSMSKSLPDMIAKEVRPCPRPFPAPASPPSLPLILRADHSPPSLTTSLPSTPRRRWKRCVGICTRIRTRWS